MKIKNVIHGTRVRLKSSSKTYGAGGSGGLQVGALGTIVDDNADFPYVSWDEPTDKTYSISYRGENLWRVHINYLSLVKDEV